jgi:DNA polymerase-1
MNFGVIYLISPQGLSDQIAEYIADLELAGEPVDVDPWPVDKCEKFIGEWYKLYPEVKDYQLEQLAMARRKGYVVDKFGRRRFIPEVFSPIRSVQETGARMAANMPVQSSAQGIIKIAMGTLWRELPKTEWYRTVKWLMQIHDSLITETPEDLSITVPFLRWMRSIMINAVKLKIPIKVDFKSGKNWSALKDINLDNNEYV